MNSHGISLTLETGVTGAFTTGEAAFAANSVHWDRFIGLGANISALRIDDPWSNGVASQSLSYGTIVQEVSDWIELVRDNYPGIQIVLLEAFPTHSAGQIADFIDDLNSEASSRSVAGLDAFEIDWDINEGGSWSDVEWLYDEIRNRYMDFNVIYWGSGAASSDCDFLERTMDLAYGFASRGMVPDTYTIESWNAYPSDTLPEPAVPSYDCTMMALAAHVIFSAYYPVYDTFGYSVSLRTSDNTHYVVAENDGGDVVNADRTSIGAWETFKLLDLNGGSLNGGDPVALVTGGAWNFRAENNGAMLADEGVVPVEREIFTLLNLDSPGNSIGDGTKVALQSYDGYYACAEYGGGDTVNVNRTSIGSWEEFTLIIH